MLTDVWWQEQVEERPGAEVECRCGRAKERERGRQRGENTVYE